MPPLRQHQQLSNIEATENIPPNSSSDLIDNSNNNDNKENRRGRRAPSIDTRASRVGVTNFINVIKNLHPGESRTHFPITQESLQEYIDSKRKALIKAGSLEQYLQHIQAYNIALGFGWQGQIFGPIIKKALDELRAYEEENRKKLIIHHHQPQLTFTPINSIEYKPSNTCSSTTPTANSTTPAADIINKLEIDANHKNNNSNDAAKPLIYNKDTHAQEHLSSRDEQLKIIPLVCFDITFIPHVIMDEQVNVSLSNLNSTDPLQNLRELYSNIASLSLPSQWDIVDTSHVHYRIGNWNDSQHFGLTDKTAFTHFWEAFIASLNEHQKQVQLVVYRKPKRLHHAESLYTVRASSLPHIHVHAFDGSASETILKSVTIRSKLKTYKQKIAIGENTTFASLIAFATNKATPPVGKQFVIRSIDETFEYIPENLVKEVITGMEHTDLLVTLEDVSPINFDSF